MIGKRKGIKKKERKNERKRISKQKKMPYLNQNFHVWLSQPSERLEELAK